MVDGRFLEACLRDRPYKEFVQNVAQQANYAGVGTSISKPLKANVKMLAACYLYHPEWTPNDLASEYEQAASMYGGNGGSYGGMTVVIPSRNRLAAEMQQIIKTATREDIFLYTEPYGRGTNTITFSQAFSAHYRNAHKNPWRWGAGRVDYGVQEKITGREPVIDVQ